MTSFDFLKMLNSKLMLPLDRTVHKKPSNQCLFRWLSDGAVSINGVKPKPKDSITFPITELVFFPNGSRCTFL